MNKDEDIRKIYHFWFGDIENGTTVEKRNRLWFGGDKETDETIKANFEPLVLKAQQGELDHWQDTPEGTMALIILLDQFPLNMYRKSSKAYDFEAKALAICLAGLAKKQHEVLSFVEKTFFYLPLEHSENQKHQEMCVDLYQHLYETAEEHLREHAKGSLNYAVKHKEIIDRFGRYPHRNEVLGRKSNSEEIAFLKDPSNRFGQ